ncbi:acyl-CoA synthetase [Geodermatophilus marinus]|uniref:acyl-CoA synthetase n=1 Tax=Geodermatophilus sp. LHW52908 TaxID=2303986 RepID=UPI000E3D5998|nr:acyl-CoA synthetase [Geodermatophilus sp. LHW52908]RFU21507.1 acyl-CoA synthetase [Geodermatophilus sp. LHW52908]
MPWPGAFARTAPDRPALVMAGSGATLTYAELEERSTRLASWLRAQGLRPGDVVALLTDNRLEVSEVYWACQRAGLYVTAVNWHLAPAEATYVVADSGARVLVAAATLAPLARHLRAAVPALEAALSVGGPVEGFTGYADALAAGDPVPPADQPRGADLLYSSGTTGRPKGIRPPLPDRQVTEPGDSIAAVFGTRYGFGEDTVYLSPAPAYHAAPLRFIGAVQATGGSVVMMEAFDAEAALAAIERYGVTHGQFVPTMFVRMLKLPPEVRGRHDVSSLRVAVHAAAPCPPDVKRAMIDWWGPVLEEYYASTESAGVTMVGSAEWLAHPGTVGRDGFLGTVHVVGDDGRELPPGEVGVIYFEREAMPFAYLGDPERTAQAQHLDHPTWSTVGDMGYLDEDRWLYLTDRQSNMIISGGVNVYPREAEDVLALHPAVHDVAVIGVPDEEMGESVLALVQPAPGTGTAGLADELVSYTRQRLSHFKCPSRVEFVDELPRTPTGKLQKHLLRRRYAATEDAGRRP